MRRCTERRSGAGFAGFASCLVPPSITEPPPDLLDGTLSGLGDEEDDDSPKSSWLRFPSPLQPWLDFKQQVLLQQYGLLIGGSEGILGQDYSSSLTGQHDAVGQKFTLNVGQQLLWQGTPQALWIEAVIEDRGPVGTEFAPLQAGLQDRLQHRDRANLGRLQPRRDAALFAPEPVRQPLPVRCREAFRAKLRQSLSSVRRQPPVPQSDLHDERHDPGSLARLRRRRSIVSDQFRALRQGGIYTVYSDDVGFTADSFFNKPQYFTHLELGWSGTAASGTPIQARGPMDANNFSVTLWNKDAEQNGPAAAHGVAFNANYLVQDNVMVFGRGGWSEGWQLDRNLSAGIAWRPVEHYSDLFGIGGGWAQPANPNLRDQYIFEAFYRFQLTTQLAITPDIQWILHPTLNPNTGSLWVASLRARITF